MAEEELEILESIYPDELEVHSETEFSIRLPLEVAPERHLLVNFIYPEGYPDAAVDLHIQPINGPIETNSDEDDSDVEPESQPPVDAVEGYDFTSADVAELEKIGKESAEENIGMPAVFTVVSQIKEEAENLYNERIAAREQQRLKEIEAAEAKEQEKFHGTPVTKESFNKWREEFRREKGLDKPKERPFGRLSGREIFERGLDEESDDDDGIEDEN